METAIIISDVHLGSRHCRCERLLGFLDSLPDEATLVLNGDTMNRIHHPLEDCHQKALQRFAGESRRRRVVWIRGNHDDGYTPADRGEIEFRSGCEPAEGIYVSHGHDFDNIMPRNRWFILLFRFVHRVRLRLGAEPVHVAFYAKRFRFLYDVLRRHVMANAVEHARERGYRTVVCGHTHFPEDVTVDGVRYLNTGSWTEEPMYCVRVDEAGVARLEIRGGSVQAPSP